MTRSYATPVDLRQHPVWATARAMNARRSAILITGADGQFVAIEPLADSDDLPADQLTVRAKRLFKGQRAQLISYTVTLEV